MVDKVITLNRKSTQYMLLLITLKYKQCRCLIAYCVYLKEILFSLTERLSATKLLFKYDRLQRKLVEHIFISI